MLDRQGQQKRIGLSETTVLFLAESWGLFGAIASIERTESTWLILVDGYILKITTYLWLL